MKVLHYEPNERIGRVLRAQYDETDHEPLPKRWIDLLNYLNEKDRRRRRTIDRDRNGPHASRSGQLACAERGLLQRRHVLRLVLRGVAYTILSIGPNRVCQHSNSRLATLASYAHFDLTALEGLFAVLL